VADTLAALDNYYKGDAKRQERFRQFAIKTLRPAFDRVGWEAKPGEADPVAILRATFIGTLSQLGDEQVIAEARRRFAASATDANALPAPLRKTILGVVGAHADAATWDKLHAMAKTEKTPLVRDQLYTLLSISDDPAIAQRALDLALTDEPGETNSAGMIATVAQQHPEQAFDFALANREAVGKRVDTTSQSRYYPSLASSSLDPAMVGKLRTYADQYIAAGSRRPTETAIANIEYRVKIRKERMGEIDAWLAKQGG
jgi:aminopeptidase N